MNNCQPHYTIVIMANTGLGVVHYCTIYLPELKSQEDRALDKLHQFREKFPAPDFKVEMTYWNIVGETVDVPEKEEVVYDWKASGERNARGDIFYQVLRNGEPYLKHGDIVLGRLLHFHEAKACADALNAGMPLPKLGL